MDGRGAVTLPEYAGGGGSALLGLSSEVALSGVGM